MKIYSHRKNCKFKHLLQVTQTNLLDHFQCAIKLDLLYQERDLLRCMIVDSTIQLFLHPPVLSIFLYSQKIKYLKKIV